MILLLIRSNISVHLIAPLFLLLLSQIRFPFFALSQQYLSSNHCKTMHQFLVDKLAVFKSLTNLINANYRSKKLMNQQVSFFYSPCTYFLSWRKSIWPVSGSRERQKLFVKTTYYDEGLLETKLMFPFLCCLIKRTNMHTITCFFSPSTT